MTKCNVTRICNFTLNSYCAFTPDAARASKWPEVIHNQCEPAARAAWCVLDDESVEES